MFCGFCDTGIKRGLTDQVKHWYTEKENGVQLKNLQQKLILSKHESDLQ